MEGLAARVVHAMRALGAGMAGSGQLQPVTDAAAAAADTTDATVLRLTLLRAAPLTPALPVSVQGSVGSCFPPSVFVLWVSVRSDQGA